MPSLCRNIGLPLARTREKDITKTNKQKKRYTYAAVLKHAPETILVSHLFFDLLHATEVSYTVSVSGTFLDLLRRARFMRDVLVHIFFFLCQHQVLLWPTTKQAKLPPSISRAVPPAGYVSGYQTFSDWRPLASFLLRHISSALENVFFSPSHHWCSLPLTFPSPSPLGRSNARWGGSAHLGNLR